MENFLGCICRRRVQRYGFSSFVNLSHTKKFRSQRAYSDKAADYTLVVFRSV